MFTYAYFVYSDDAAGVFTFGKADIDTAYANWTNINIMPGSFVFDNEENQPTNIKVKLAQNSSPVFLIAVPQINWNIQIPAEAADDGITESEVSAALSDLDLFIKEKLTEFGIEGIHNFDASQEIILNDKLITAYIYTGAGSTPTEFDSSTEISVFDITNLILPASFNQSKTLPSDSTSGSEYIVQSWCGADISVGLYAIQSRNLNQPSEILSTQQICFAAGLLNTPEKTLQNMSWAEIDEIASLGQAQNYFNVGDEKNIMLSNGEIITLTIHGFEHDDLSDGSGKAKITFGMKDLLSSLHRLNAQETNTGGWNQCEFRNVTAPILLNQLPDELQNIIVNVNKKASAGNQSSTILTSSDRLFLFSRVEIDGTTASVYINEGTQYEYWRTVKDGTLDAARIKRYANGTGNIGNWWLRSPQMNSSTNPNGFLAFYSIAVSNPSTSAVGVSYGFCIGR